VKRATVTETKNRLSALLAEVRAGETVLIVDRGVPVAKIEGLASTPDDVEGRLERLQKSGAVRVGHAEPPLGLASKKRPRLAPEASVVEALLEERREGR
jgi:prevent-host-death family protein